MQIKLFDICLQYIRIFFSSISFAPFLFFQSVSVRFFYIMLLFVVVFFFLLFVHCGIHLSIAFTITVLCLTFIFMCSVISRFKMGSHTRTPKLHILCALLVWNCRNRCVMCDAVMSLLLLMMIVLLTCLLLVSELFSHFSIAHPLPPPQKNN